MADLTRALVARGLVVQMITLMPPEGVLGELRRVTPWIASMNMERFLDVRTSAGRLRNAVRTFAPDVVQTALFHANVLGRFSLRGIGVPMVSGYQSLDLDMSRARRTVDRLTAPLATRHVAVSRAVADVVAARARIPRDRIDVIPIGKGAPRPGDRQAVRKMLGIPPEAVVVGFVGRLHPVKQLPDLVKACRYLAGEVWILAVGDGPDRPVVERYPRAVVTGTKQDVGPFLSAMDVFVLPSRWEGMPGALIEAMAAGLPVVATSVGGANEVVTHGRDGYLVQPGSPARLADAIVSTLTHPGLGRAAANTAREKFSLDAMVTGYLRVYESVAAGSAPRVPGR
jgi:glycosyltransferase involved in cell wall biosynthesis